MTIEMKVAGMTCGHCERAVTQAVQRVDPANLAASFGPGIRLKRITVEVTDDDVTTGIEKRLRWLSKHRGTLKPNPPSFMDDPNDPELRLLGKGPFTTELVK
jgi:copper chaperone CopZ